MLNFKTCHFLSFWFLVLCWKGSAYGQNFEISPEINLRNDFAYYILPFGKEVSVIRDKSYKLTIQNLRPDMSWTVEKDLELKGRKWRILDTYTHGNDIGILYLTKVENKVEIFYGTYDQNGILKQELVLPVKTVIEYPLEFNLISSDNQKWVSMSFNDRKNIKWICVFNRFHPEEFLAKPAEELFDSENENVEKASLGDDGNFYLLWMNDEHPGFRDKSIIKIQGVDQLGRQILNKEVVLKEGFDIYDLDINYNNFNKNLYLAGLYKEKNEQYADGYLIQNLSNGEELHMIEFDKEKLKEWTGKSKKSSVSSLNFAIKKICFKEDGSSLVFMENSKELSRRPYFNNTLDNSGIGTMRWVDYYFDDIFVVCFSPNGEKQWENILRKKQFSQDDDGLYSSFFIFTNRSFLRILFNDEIKNESTVSQYLLLPDGRINRKSVLNTSNTKLNLRITDAIQIDETTLIVPSENNGKMSLVRLNLL
ncbi:MAG: hypothetical protein JNK69_05060 [Saprospiraceae bacterium]|nr:hypothetical protein [Candidatus Vicinibacter proximus]MBL7822755.1 hypothetical protein [Saprospiraceae bacterium]